MQSHKRCIQSVLLNRMAHADVFEVDARPRWLFLLFGGSGVDDDEYLERSKTTIPIFGRVLDYLAKCGVDLVLIHVTAPYDVPFNRFSADPSSADTWNCHVLSELIEPWSRLPFFVCGFSGGGRSGFERRPRRPSLFRRRWTWCGWDPTGLCVSGPLEGETQTVRRAGRRRLQSPCESTRGRSPRAGDRPRKFTWHRGAIALQIIPLSPVLAS